MAVFIGCRVVLALFLCFYVLCFDALFSHAAISTIQSAQFIKDGETLVSDGLNFEMGFFSLGSSSSRYVGIWYYNVPSPAYIWVANRQKPVQGRVGSITVNKEGNLVILDGENKEVWSSNVSTSSNDTKAILQDDGNLVLSLNDSSSVFWQSFENPTDSYVPGMKVPVGRGKSTHPGFTSWKSATDPSRGNYTMVVESGESPPQIVIFEGERRRWRSGFWDGRIFTGVSNMTGNYLFGFRLNDDNGGRYFVYTPLNKSDKVRFNIGWDGFERQFRWNENAKNWTVTQSVPFNQCEHYNHCGSFAVCDLANSPVCSCLQGFKPRNLDQWGSGNWSGGCVRRTPLKAETQRANNGSGTMVSVGEDGFFQLNNVKFPDFALLVNSSGTSSDCESTCLRNSSCTAHAFALGIGCLIWQTELDDIQRFENLADVINIRLADADLGNGNKKTKIWVITVVVVGSIICLGIFAWLVWRYKRKLKAKQFSDLPVLEATNNSTALSLEFSESADLGLEGNQLSGPELPFFKFSSIVIATNNFSEEHKLGQGGFGPVYKGMLAGGEVAVKRLSTRSGQGLEEFKNEMMLIAKLQHRNLVRLVGYSIQAEEKLLLYEYLPNRSLDGFLFDSVKQKQLDWTKRFEIIEGIARGLLYLHRDSRLRIIHRDLKASNILLDENMNPKISDFGLARIFGGNENEDNTTKVVGTYGYIAPEYAMEGLFSVKSDVFSFGVLLLEIVCGRRNSSFRHTDDTSLVGYAWHLWSEKKAKELVDPSICDSSSHMNEVLRCIQIGMLCIQDSASIRPNMASVVLMLESEATTLPLPRLPVFPSMRRHTYKEFNEESFDVSNDLSVSIMTGR